MHEVYVAVARYGGTLDDVQVFDSMPIAVARVREWASGMEPQFEVNEPEMDVLGEYLSDGETWYFDVLPCPVRTVEAEAVAQLAELRRADVLDDAEEDPGRWAVVDAVVREFETRVVGL